MTVRAAIGGGGGEDGGAETQLSAIASRYESAQTDLACDWAAEQEYDLSAVEAVGEERPCSAERSKRTNEKEEREAVLASKWAERVDCAS